MNNKSDIPVRDSQVSMCLPGATFCATNDCESLSCLRCFPLLNRKYGKKSMKNTINNSQLVYIADGSKAGVLTGNTRLCSMDGCRGLRHDVKWPDGKITRPCGQGLKLRKDGAQQIA